MSSAAANQPFVFTPNLNSGGTASDPLVDQTRREIAAIVREIAEAAASDCNTDQFLTLLVDRVLRAMAAEGVVIWHCDLDHPPRQYRCVKRLGRITDRSIPDDSVATHQQLLLEVATHRQPVVVPPTPGTADEQTPANPLETPVALAPIECEPTADVAEYLIEVVLEPDCGVATQRGYLRFVAQMTDLAGEFLRSDQLRQFRRLRTLAAGVDAAQPQRRRWPAAATFAAACVLVIAAPLVVYSQGLIQPSNDHGLAIGRQCMLSCCLLAGPKLAPAQSTSTPEMAGAGIEVQNCIVRFAREVQVPALETGRVAELMVVANDTVQAGATIARLDNRSMLILRRASMLRMRAAEGDATDEVELRYARVALAEAEAELDSSRSILTGVRGSMPLSHVRRLKLAVERGQLEVAQAQKRIRQAELQVLLCEADLSVIDDQLKKLNVQTPIGGIVLDTTRSAGEWIEQGQPIATVARFDRLHVHASVDSRKIPAAMYRDLPVSVRWIDRGSGQPMSLRGKVLSVDPQELPDGKFRLHAEIINRTVSSDPPQWLLRPGAEVSMKVYPSAARSRSAAEPNAAVAGKGGPGNVRAFSPQSVIPSRQVDHRVAW